MEEQPTQEAAAPPAPKKKGGWLKTIVIVTVLLVAAGGGGAWWFLGSASAEAEEEPAPETRGVVPFEPYLVNLADAGGNRFLKATIHLVLATQEDAKHVEETAVVLLQLRSAILELLTQQSAPALVTDEGKQALKTAIKARVAPLLKDRQVIDVLFSEFVVQF